MTAPMTPERFAEIEALERQTSAAPWEVRTSYRRGTTTLVMVELIRPPKSGSNAPVVKTWKTHELADVEFIAESRTAVPELLAEVRRLRRELIRSNRTVKGLS
jgi:hypothetical protein